MHCAQSGCEIKLESLIELGYVPNLCPTCNHPLMFGLTRFELAEAVGLPNEDDVLKTTQLPLVESETDEQNLELLSDKRRDEGLGSDEPDEPVGTSRRGRKS